MHQIPFVAVLGWREPFSAGLDCIAESCQSSRLALGHPKGGENGTLKISSSVGVTHITSAGPPMQSTAPLQGVSGKFTAMAHHLTHAEMALMYARVDGMVL